MKIKRVEIFPITQPIQIVSDFSFGSYTSDKAIVVRITSDTGVTGVGSCGGLRPHFSGESVKSAIDNITRISKEYLIGEDPFCIEKIVDKMDQMLAGNNCTKSNIDCALYDLKGKALKLPVYELLGGKCRSRVKLSWVICGASSHKAIIEEALGAKEAGYEKVKIRGFGDPKADIERFMAVRNAVGDDLQIAIDCNGSYRDVKSAYRALKFMEDHGLVSVEEPLQRGNIKGLKYLKDNLLIPVTVDESAWSLKDVVEMIHADAIDSVEIAPCRMGGLTKAIRCRTLCDAFGIGRTLTQYGQNGIVNAVTAHMIVASTAPGNKDEELGGLIQYHGERGFYDSEHIVNDIIRQPSVVISGGYLEVPATPGLGVELDEESIMHCISEGYTPVVIE